MVDITVILKIVIELMLALVTAFIIPYIKKNYSMAQLDEILIWVKIAVQAAEQIYSSSQAQEKKGFVIKYVTDKGFNINIRELDAAIEASVLELHHELYGSGE